MKVEDVCSWTMVQISNGIQEGRISAEAVVRAHLEYIEKLNPILNCFVSFNLEYSIDQLRSLSLRSKNLNKLFGVPVGVKDVFNTEHFFTEKGSEAWAGYRAGNDARCVSYLKAEGCIIVGKTDTAELAVHTPGKAKNPYDLSRTTGTSSGGSAVAVASGMVPFALGTQTGGSVIRPASWCGVYAMKPSFGLIPRTGVLKTADTLDTVGLFVRGLFDLRYAIDTLRVKGDNFPIHEKELAALAQHPNRKFRVGILSSRILDSANQSVKTALKDFALRLDDSKIVDVIPIDLPSEVEGFHGLHRRLYHPALAYYLSNEHRTNPRELSPVLKGIFEDAKSIPASDYAVALREQSSMAARLNQLFEEHDLDALICNSSIGGAPELEPMVHMDLNALWTMTWLPVINVPGFFDGGLPFGLQFIGRRYGDYRLLNVLEALGGNSILPLSSEVRLPSPTG